MKSIIQLSICLLGGIVSSGIVRAETNVTSGRPNIVWIVAENFALDFGCFGAANVSTPNVDGLAKSGVRFTNVYSTSPVCAPSRSAFMTGMYATTTDMHNMRSHREDDYRLPPRRTPVDSSVA